MTLTEITKEAEKEFAIRFLSADKDGVPELKIDTGELGFIAELEDFIASLIQEVAEQTKETMMVEEYQNITLSERPKLYENKGWLGWNAARSQMLANYNKFIGK